EKTRLRHEQLGEALGEELAGDFTGASQGYLALERNFSGLGDQIAAGWAYRKRRRMQKMAELSRARDRFRAGQLQSAARSFTNYASDQLVEWLCDYGESIPRVLASLLILHLFFTAIYGLTGSVVRIIETPGGELRTTTYNPADLMTFSL